MKIRKAKKAVTKREALKAQRFIEFKQKLVDVGILTNTDESLSSLGQLRFATLADVEWVRREMNENTQS